MPCAAKRRAPFWCARTDQRALQRCSAVAAQTQLQPLQRRKLWAKTAAPATDEENTAVYLRGSALLRVRQGGRGEPAGRGEKGRDRNVATDGKRPFFAPCRVRGGKGAPLGVVCNGVAGALSALAVVAGCRPGLTLAGAWSTARRFPADRPRAQPCRCGLVPWPGRGPRPPGAPAPRRCPGRPAQESGWPRPC